MRGCVHAKAFLSCIAFFLVVKSDTDSKQETTNLIL